MHETKRHSGEPDSSQARGTLEQYAGPARVTLWRGGAASLRSGLSPEKSPNLHCHFAIQLTAGYREAVSLRASPSDPEERAGGWLIGSDQPHAMGCAGLGLTILFDPLFPEGRRLAGRLAGRSVVALETGECEAVREQIERCWRRGWQLPDLQAAAGRIADQIAPTAAHADSLDPRVRAVVDNLMLDSSENVGLPELAAGVGLSESRLAHLFRRDVGIPMRQYRLFLRMVQAVTYISRGSSLTEAAHMAGFSDSAHFCRICRRIYGSTPSDLPDFESVG